MVEIQWINSKNWRFWPYKPYKDPTIDLIYNQSPYKSEKKNSFSHSPGRRASVHFATQPMLSYITGQGVYLTRYESTYAYRIYSSWKTYHTRPKFVIKKRIYYDICPVNFVLHIPKKQRILYRIKNRPCQWGNGCTNSMSHEVRSKSVHN